MKKLVTLLTAVFGVSLFVGCGGGSSGDGSSSGSDNNPPQVITPPSSIAGSGTLDDPYIVGNGEFSFNNSAYFEILSTKPDCNVIAYSVAQLNPFNQTEMYDDVFVSIPEKEGNIYNMTSLGSYKINAIAYRDTAILGIYSTCIDQPNSYEIETISNNTQNSFSGQRSSKLYKFNVPSDSNVTVREIQNIGYAYYYDSELNFISSKYAYSASPIELTAGEYYVLVTQLGFNSEETPIFYFAVEPN